MEKRVIKKVLPAFFEAVQAGDKTFELRKDEDGIQPGDILILREWDGTKYTGRNAVRLVTYVLRDAAGYGLMDGYCAIGIRPMTEEKRSGVWAPVKKRDGTVDFRCSACRRFRFHNGEMRVRYRYCPRCGARMDGRRENG